MRLIRPSAKIMDHSITYESAVSLVAEAAAQCYNKSLPEDFTEREDYVRNRMKSGHESIIEHASVSAKFTVDRGVTHELVRHRLCAFTQESTRYCNYSKDKFGGHVTFIIPPWFPGIPECVLQQAAEIEGTNAYDYAVDRASTGEFHLVSEDVLSETFFVGSAQVWLEGVWQAEAVYLLALKNGMKPEEARGLLPNATKADIIVTANMREWRHIFKLRALGTTGRPHPQMLEVMKPLLEEFKREYPVFFADLILE